MEQIGHYKIIQKIGEGGMGEVYKGIDPMLEREVAIKLMRPELSNRPEILERFRSEAIALGRMNHSNIAAVYNFGQDQNQYYMALEFVSGETLGSIIKDRGKLPWQTALNYAVAALEGLEHAHQLRIIHRDIKPANIMINEKNNVKIMDFGIARILEKARMTKTGNFIGTLEYMSPEQIQGKEVDARADIYSMGAVLYEMLTGHILFTRDTDFELMNSQISEKPKPPREFNQAIPLKLEKIVLQALEKDPAKRFSSAHEFSQVLRKLALVEAVEESATESSAGMSFFRNYPAVVIAGLLLVPAGSYALWKMNSAASPQSITTPAPQTVSLPPAEIQPVNQLPQTDNGSVAIMVPTEPLPSPSSKKLPQLTLPAEEKLIPENPVFEEPEAKTPQQIKKPENAKKEPVQTAKKPKDTPPKQSNNPKESSQNKAPSTEEDPGIDDWAEDFFRKP